MQGIDWTSLITVIISLFGGGVIGVAIKALSEKKKINAEATNTNIKSLLEIDQRMNERMAKLEERVANLEQENYKLKLDKLALEKEKLQEENCLLKAEIDMLQTELDNKEVK